MDALQRDRLRAVIEAILVRQLMDDDSHTYAGCVRAYGALSDAAARVTARLAHELESRFSLHINEFDTLLALDEQPDKALSLSGLLERVRLSQPALSRLSDRLERRGLISRRGSARDRRSVVVQLTAAGQELLGRALPVHMHCVQDALLNRLTVQERSVLKSILLKISK